jgi:hypothetical protein
MTGAVLFSEDVVKGGYRAVYPDESTRCLMARTEPLPLELDPAQCDLRRMHIRTTAAVIPVELFAQGQMRASIDSGSKADRQGGNDPGRPSLGLPRQGGPVLHSVEGPGRSRKRL